MSPTLEERVAKLELDVQRLNARSDNGSTQLHSLTDVMGIGADDPLFDEWLEAIAERRRELDADPSVP
jgi:hypothetical protein